MEQRILMEQAIVGSIYSRDVGNAFTVLINYAAQASGVYRDFATLRRPNRPALCGWKPNLAVVIRRFRGDFRTQSDMRLIVALLASLCLVGSLSAQETQTSTIGICKGDPLPPDRVIVAEFESPQCEPPESKNAWDTAHAEDGLTTCQNTRSVSAFASVMELVICEKVYSPKCPERKDGTPNGYVWRAPGECEKQKSNLGIESKLRLVCNTTDMVLGSEEYIIAETKTGTCNGVPRTTGSGSAWIVRDYAGLNLVRISCVDADGKPLDKEFTATDVILRRFSDRYCPNPGTLNAIALSHYGGSTMPGASLPNFPDDATYCFGSPLLKFNEEKFDRVFDAGCGGDTGKPNAFKLKQWPNIAGEWLSNGNGGTYLISQSAGTLSCSGASGPATGYFTGPSTFVMQWKANTWEGTIVSGGNRINWNNNSVWTRK